MYEIWERSSVRLSYTKNSAGVLEILEENNYYPFGLKHSGYNNIRGANSSYQYKYNGKELQESGMYDYGWRQYASDIGRWIQLDPLVEDTGDPYAYVYNNPISLKDPDGRLPDDGGDESCCSNIKGFLAAVVDNVTGISNLVERYNDGSLEYNRGVSSGNVASTIGGILLTIDGGSNIAAGGTGLVASAAVSTTGVGSVVGGPGAVVSGGLVVKGTTEVVGGAYILSNVSKNIQRDNNSSSNASSQQKGGGKNGQHANQKAKQSAEQKYNQAKSEYDALKSKPNKTKADNKALDKLKTQVDHLKKKTDFTGENHSRNAKGNR